MRRSFAALAAVLCLGAGPAPPAQTGVALSALLSDKPAPTLAARLRIADESVSNFGRERGMEG